MSESKKLFLLDAYALIFRAYYAFINNPMTNSKGLNTSTILGFVNTMDEVLRKETPSHIAVVFDPSGPTFRKDLYPEYKANREATPEDIKLTIPWIKKIIEAYNIPVVEVENFEADDVIGTLAFKAEKEGFTVFMMTPDKDYSQLVSDNIFMFKPKRSGNDIEILGPKEINEKFQTSDPKQVIDVLALWGDSSDNVPGVPGIGEKTAKKLISEYGSIENVYKNLDQFKGKQRENLENFIDQAKLSKELVTIVTDVPCEFNAESFKLTEFNRELLQSLFEELEFKNLANRLLGANASTGQPQAVTTPAKPEGAQGNLFSGFASPEENPVSDKDNIDTVEKSYRHIQTSEDLQNLVKKIKELKAFCFDTETTGIDVINARLLGISISFKAHEAYYISFDEKDLNSGVKINLLKSILEDKAILKIGQNLKFDIRMLKKYGVEVNGEIFDTMVAHYLIQPEQRHNLNALSEQYLNYTPVSIESLIGKKGKNQGNMENVALEKVVDYAAEDADLTWQLFEILKPELEKEDLSKLAEEIEMPLVYVLADMEQAGVKIDTEILKIAEKELVEDIIGIEKSIFDLAGVEFNIASPKQLGEILFDRLKLSSEAKKTKTKQYSTGEDVLVKLKDKHEIVGLVLEYRSLKKLLSTYVEALPKLINPITGRLHASFNQTLVATGRLSSNNPNLQNIPIREERGREIRRAFIPEDKTASILSADYSQIELRLMAHLSKDENLIDAFKKGEDIHTATAAKIFSIDPKEVTREMRSKAKTANFGIIYGISAFGLSQRLNIPRTEAKDLIDGYFNSFPGVKAYMDLCIKNARETSCVYTIMGRKRYLPDIHSRNAVVRGVAERNAINAPIQGSAADIIKIAMVNIHKRIKSENLKTQLILQVHDELNFEVPANELETMKSILKEEMESAIKLSVPLTIDMGTGANWLEAH
jgi:DNA polymerase-1